MVNMRAGPSVGQLWPHPGKESVHPWPGLELGTVLLFSEEAQEYGHGYPLCSF